jgi:pimeloyl-ACP methyl ester carboxylesterase
MMTEPYLCELPTATIDAVSRWLLSQTRSRAADARPRIASTGSAAPGACSAVLRSTRTGTPRPGLIERAVFLSSRPRIFGILTEPLDPTDDRKAVVLLNDGASQHVSSNRMHVELARTWGERGYFVLRMDLAGLGDSEARPGQPDNEVFPPAALDDISSAVEFLRSRYGIREVTLAGVCAGGYHSLRAAVAGEAVDRIILINPLNFYWKAGRSLKDIQVIEAIRNPEVYRERVRSGAAWKKLLTGGTNVWRILLIYAHRAVFELDAAMRRAARPLGIHLPRDLGKDLEELAARGVRIAFVFARGEPGIDLLRRRGGWALPRLGDRCRIHVINGADHIFNRPHARRELEAILSAELFGDPPAACDGAVRVA